MKVLLNEQYDLFDSFYSDYLLVLEEKTVAFDEKKVLLSESWERGELELAESYRLELIEIEKEIAELITEWEGKLNNGAKLLSQINDEFSKMGIHY